MNNYEDEIDKLIECMDKAKVPLKDQIEYLKIYSKDLNRHYEILSNDLLVGTFISATGLGISISEPHIGIGLMLTGIGVSLVSGKISTNNFEKTYKNKVLKNKKN